MGKSKCARVCVRHSLVCVCHSLVCISVHVLVSMFRCSGNLSNEQHH